MPKIGKNQPYPCGSGRKYKLCCWHRDRAAHVPAMPAVSQHGFRWAETELDRLSNSVVSLVDEADAACEQLRIRYSEVHDWLMRKAMDCKTRTETNWRSNTASARSLGWMHIPRISTRKAANPFAGTSSVFEARSQASAEQAGSVMGHRGNGSAATRRARTRRPSRRRLTRRTCAPFEGTGQGVPELTDEDIDALFGPAQTGGPTGS